MGSIDETGKMWSRAIVPLLMKRAAAQVFFVFFGQEKKLWWFLKKNFKAPPIYHVDLFQFPAINAEAILTDFACKFASGTLIIWTNQKPTRGLSNPTMGQTHFCQRHACTFFLCTLVFLNRLLGPRIIGDLDKNSGRTISVVKAWEASVKLLSRQKRVC